MPEKHQSSCHKEQTSQSLIVSNDGYLQNAVISLKGDFKGHPSQEMPSFTMDQKNCNFEPHILIVPENSSFWVANSDPMAHDVRVFRDADMLFRFEMDVSEKPVEKKLEKGTYLVRCGLHPWMHAFIITTAHSYYAVSNEKGEFALNDVPAGKHILHIWHETLGEAEIPIEVTHSIQDFSYTFPSSIQNA